MIELPKKIGLNDAEIPPMNTATSYKNKIHHKEYNMKFIEPKVEYISKKTPLQQIEYVARICWNSRDKITATSAMPFCEKLVSMGHTSPFEHCRIILPKITKYDLVGTYGIMDRIQTIRTKGSQLAQTANCRDALSFGYTVAEIADLELSVDSYTFELTIPISIAREFVRHRSMSFMEQSTRYVDMSDMSFILKAELRPVMTTSLMFAQEFYKKALDDGFARQDAREILPLCTATKLVMTGTEENWDAFFKLRCSAAAHPLAREIAEEIRNKISKIKEKNEKEEN